MVKLILKLLNKGATLSELEVITFVGIEELEERIKNLENVNHSLMDEKVDLENRLSKSKDTAIKAIKAASGK